MVLAHLVKPSANDADEISERFILNQAGQSLPESLSMLGSPQAGGQAGTRYPDGTVLRLAVPEPGAFNVNEAGSCDVEDRAGGR